MQYENQYDEIDDTNHEEDYSKEKEEVREDKIFNNRYNKGDGLIESEEYEYSRKISVCHEYSHEYLMDLYEYEEAINSKLILNTIFNFVQEDSEIMQMLSKKTSKPFSIKIKLSREEINFLFNKISEGLRLKINDSLFYSPIYVLDVISSITSIEYKKLFDLMETEIQELLLVELNTKYQILEGKIHKKRIH